MIAVILFGTAGLCSIALGLFLHSLNKPRSHRRQSAMFGGDVTGSVIIDCETSADVVIAGSAKNVTMENVRHRPASGPFGTWIQWCADHPLAPRPLAQAFGEWTEGPPSRATAADWVKATEHELGINGHEDTCDICGPQRTCLQLDRVGAFGMVAWCPIGQGEKVCSNCNWTGRTIALTEAP